MKRTAPASEIDPTGAFERAYAETAGVPIDAVHRPKGNAMTGKTDELLRPIVGVENRTAQEVFDIMCDRIAAWNRRTAQPAVKALLETLETTAQRLKNAEWEDGASSDHVRRVLREGTDVCNAAIAALVSAPADRPIHTALPNYAGWRSIDTAPEDCRVILAAAGNWVGEAIMLRDEDSGEQVWTWVDTGKPSRHSLYGWMHLPSPLSSPVLSDLRPDGFDGPTGAE